MKPRGENKPWVTHSTYRQEANAGRGSYRGTPRSQFAWLPRIVGTGSGAMAFNWTHWVG